MVDLETLATTPDATILTIGAIKFDPVSEYIDDDVFYTRVISPQGRRVDPSTVDWWNSQSPSAQEEVFKATPACAIEQMLTDFIEWLDGKPVMWCQGLTFDVPILEDCFRQFNLKCPWDFWDTRDTRTIYYAAGDRFQPFVPDSSSAHVAWKDAYAQCISVQRAMRVLRMR